MALLAFAEPSVYWGWPGKDDSQDGGGGAIPMTMYWESTESADDYLKENVACRWTCARQSRNLASTRGNGKCRVDSHEIHTCLYNMPCKAL